MADGRSDVAILKTSLADMGSVGAWIIANTWNGLFGFG
jgi:hypothetical protein